MTEYNLGHVVGEKGPKGDTCVGGNANMNCYVSKFSIKPL